MKRIVLAIIMIIALSGIAAQGVTLTLPEGNVSVSVSNDANSYQKIPTQGWVMQQIELRLQELEKYYLSRLTSANDQRAIKQMMENIRGLLIMLPVDPNALATGPVAAQSPNINININTTPVPPAPAPEAITVNPLRYMTDKEFKDLEASIQKSSFADDRLSTLQLATKNTSFSVNQIVRIIGLFTFADDKLKALRLSYPGCYDPQNNFKILDAFLFSDDKDAARKIMSAQ